MITREITKEDTSEIKVKSFLESIKDDNEAHWKYNIFPGMYALDLLKVHISKPIQRVNILFKDYTLFPAKLILGINEEEKGFHFVFSEEGTILYEGDIHYKEKSPIYNESKLKAICQIGGKLQRHFQNNGNFPEGKTPLYNYQSMDFDVHENLGELVIGDLEELKPKTFNIKTQYTTENTFEANGHAIVTVGNSKLIEMMAHRKLRKREKSGA